MINVLIDKKDNFELIKYKIASILKSELENQKSLAKAISEDKTKDYDMKIFIDKVNPLSIYSEARTQNEKGQLPIVNITFDGDDLTLEGSGNIGQQKVRGTYYIDCYAFKNKKTGKEGDEEASREADRIGTIIRNILMFDGYITLDMQRVVVRRYVTKREKMINQNSSAENVSAMRLIFEVEYLEESVRNQTYTLEEVFGQCILAQTSEVLFEYNKKY